jgi:phage terminase small subunit
LTQIEVPKTYAQLLTDLEPRQRKFVRTYIMEPNATKAAVKAGYSEKTARQMGTENLSKPVIKLAIEAGFSEQVMQQQQVLGRTADVAAGTMEDFLSIERVKYTEVQFLEPFEALDMVADAIASAEERLESAAGEQLEWWTEEMRRLRRLKRKCDRAINAPPSEKEGPTSVAIDLEWKERVVVRLDFEKAREAGKLHLVKKMKETKYGLEIELYDAAAARELLGKHYKLWSDRVSLENPDGSPLKFIAGLSEEDL